MGTYQPYIKGNGEQALVAGVADLQAKVAGQITLQQSELPEATYIANMPPKAHLQPFLKPFV